MSRGDLNDAAQRSQGAATRPDGPAPYRYEALDGLRGLCALCVCLFHFRANGPIATAGFVRGSWLFVDFFFVLAGFVIAASYRKRLIAGQFLRGFVILRFGRIYPLHFVMLAAFIVVEALGIMLSPPGMMQRAGFDGPNTPFAILTNLTLTQAFGLHPGLTWNQPAWSIAVEFWTYLAFALLAYRAGAALEKWLVIAAIVCIIVLANVSDYGINVTYRWSLFRCIYGFAIGAIAWRLWDGWGVVPGRRHAGATGMEFVMVLAVAGFVIILADSRANLLSPLLFGAVTLVFARESGLVSRVLMTAPLRHLGMLSYSIYMVHTFVQSRMDDILHITEKLFGVTMTAYRLLPSGKSVAIIGATPLAGVVLTLVMLTLVILVSQLTLKFVEMPGRRLSQRLARRAPPPNRN